MKILEAFEDIKKYKSRKQNREIQKIQNNFVRIGKRYQNFVNQDEVLIKKFIKDEVSELPTTNKAGWFTHQPDYLEKKAILNA